MSKRYGRNQRRRAREALQTMGALLHEERNRLNHERAMRRAEERRADHAEREAAALKAILAGVREALGENTVALPMVGRIVYEAGWKELPEVLRIVRPEPMPLVPCSHELANATAELTDHVAHVFEADIELNHHARNMHFFIERDRRRAVAFAIEASHLFNMPTDERERYLVRPLAQVLSKVLEQEGRHYGLRPRV